MRIAYFTNQYPAVSHTFIRREIRAIEALGIQVFRYALRPGKELADAEDKEEEKRTRFIIGSGVSEILRCCIIMLLSRPPAMFQAVRQTARIGWRSERGILRHFMYFVEAAVLARWCCQNDVQHIHAHFGTNSATIALLAWRMSGIPYSFTVHGPEEFDNAPIIGLAEKVRHCAFVVAVSSYGRSQLFRCVKQEYWSKVKVIHCGIESATFEEVTIDASTARRFVCVGRLSPQKGHLILIEAAQRLASRGEYFELVLCGDGEMRTEIEMLISRYNLQANVHILGWVDFRRVSEEIRRARALVLPSFAEGLPVAIMEAMALRRPVISTYIAGIPELVTSSENGWLVPAADVEALVDAMQVCLDADVETLAKMGETGQKSVLSNHNIRIEAERLSALFKGAAARRRSHRQSRHNDAATKR